MLEDLPNQAKIGDGKGLILRRVNAEKFSLRETLLVYSDQAGCNIDPDVSFASNVLTDTKVPTTDVENAANGMLLNKLIYGFNVIVDSES